MFSTEKEMLDAVFPKFGAALKKDGFKRKYAAREVPINTHEVEHQLYGDSKLDLAEYDKEKRLFRVIELKLGHHQTVIRDAFSQVARYRQSLKGNAHTFLDAFTRKSPMRFGRLMESTYGATKILVEFYVGLTDEACGERQFLGIMKDHYPDTGIVRVKNDGRIKDYLKKPDGTRDYEIARATAVSFSLNSLSIESRFNGKAQVSALAPENELCSIPR